MSISYRQGDAGGGKRRRRLKSPQPKTDRFSEYSNTRIVLFSIAQYLESVLNAHGLTRTLGEINVCRNADGEPVYYTGNSSIVFRIHTEAGDKALKCYTRAHRNLEKIYGQRFRPSELFLYTSTSDGVWTDVVVDDWIEGESLGNALHRAAAARDRALLAKLAEAFDLLSARLLPAAWAHGDLKPDNLIWDGSTLHLIDLDAVFLPEFCGQQSPELGTKAFQHPLRTQEDFNASLDDSPAALIATALHAACHDPSLVERYSDADGLLLDPAEIFAGQSPAYDEMLELFARRGDAIGYRTARLLVSPTLQIPQAATLFSWRIRPLQKPVGIPELDVDAGRWGFRSGTRFVIPPVWDNGFDFSEELAAVALGGWWHFIDTAGRVVLNCPPCDAVKPFRNGQAELLRNGRREKIDHPLKKIALNHYICSFGQRLICTNTDT